MAYYNVMGSDLEDLSPDELMDALSGEYDDDYDDGVGYYDIVGQARRGRGRRRGRGVRRMRRELAELKAAAAAPVIEEAGPTQGRHQPLGFFQNAVAALTQVQVTQQPQTIFRPNRLVVPQAIAPSFTIDDVRIGKNSQFVAAGGVPAEAFSGVAVSVEIQFDTCQVSQTIVLTVTNQSQSALDFRAMMLGTSLEV